MSTFNFDRFNETFQTAILIDHSVKFGCVGHGDIEDIIYNPNSDWKGEGVSLTQFYFHELGHIFHNRAAVAGWEGWEVGEDFFGEKIQNLAIEKWFKEMDFGRYQNKFKKRYNQYFVDHREWFAESHNVLVHKKMGWTLRPSQELFYDICIKGHEIHKSLTLTVEETVRLLS